MNYTTLLGAEEVTRAASNMRTAAQEFGAAVGNFTYALETHRRWMDDWLQRFEEVTSKIAPKEPPS